MITFAGLTTVEQVCRYIGGVVPVSPLCVETGTMFSVDKGNLVHTTTNNIFNHICVPNGGKLFSLDLDEQHQAIAQSVCSGPNCFYILGDSVSSLDMLSAHFVYDKSFVDVLWLDSKEFDEDHAVNEYKAIKGALRPDRHFIMVDDIHNANSVKYKKIVPILRSLNYNWVEIPTPTGLFVSWLGY